MKKACKKHDYFQANSRRPLQKTYCVSTFLHNCSLSCSLFT